MLPAFRFVLTLISRFFIHKKNIYLARMKSDTINMNRPRSWRTSGSDPVNVPYSLGIHGQFDLWSWISQQDSWQNGFHICMPRFLWRTVEFSKFFSLLSSTAGTSGKLSSAFFKLHFTGCLEFKKHTEMRWILFQSLGEGLWSLYSMCSPFCDTKSHRLLFPDTRRSITGLNERSLFKALKPPLLLWKQNKAKSWI